MQNDLDALQGTWTITSMKSEGQKFPETVFKNAQITVKGNTFKSRGMGADYRGLVKVDSKSKPKSFDISFTAGPPKGEINLGIYKLSDDSWTICLATQGNKRPHAFTSKPGTGYVVQTLSRGRATSRSKRTASPQKVTKGAAALPVIEPTTVSAPSELEGEWAMTSAVFDGIAMAESMVKWCKRITRGNITKVVAGPETFLHASFVLGRSGKIPTIDYLNLSGGNKGKKQAGIFELNRDGLTVCMAAPGRPRPTNFASKPGDGRSLTAWRRVAK